MPTISELKKLRELPQPEEVSRLAPVQALPEATDAITGPQIGQINPGLVSLTGRALGGGLSAVGNILDIPGSMVRDTLALKNPLDQLIDPLGYNADNNRTTGRQLLRQYGAVGDEDTYGNWWGGFAAEVALDPLTYTGIGALTKAGQIGQKATTGVKRGLFQARGARPGGGKPGVNILGDSGRAAKERALQEAEAAAKASGKSAKLKRSPRIASLRMTPRMVIEQQADAATRQELLQAFFEAGGTEALLDQPMRSALSFRLPFTRGVELTPLSKESRNEILDRHAKDIVERKSAIKAYREFKKTTDDPVALRQALADIYKVPSFDDLPATTRAAVEMEESFNDWVVKNYEEIDPVPDGNVDPRDVQFNEAKQRKADGDDPPTGGTTPGGGGSPGGSGGGPSGGGGGTTPSSGTPDTSFPDIDYTTVARQQPIGVGGNARVFSVDESRVLRVPKQVTGDIANDFQPVDHPLTKLGLRVGQPIAENSQGVQILQRQAGTPAGLANPLKDQFLNDAAFSTAVRSAASLPQGAYDEFAATLKTLDEAGYQFDPSKSSNVLIDSKAGRFNLVDINESTSKKPQASLEYMLIPLIGNTYASRYAGEPLQQAYQEIVSKATAAARKAGIKTELGSSGKYSLELAGLKDLPEVTSALPVANQGVVDYAATTETFRRLSPNHATFDDRLRDLGLENEDRLLIQTMFQDSNLRFVDSFKEAAPLDLKNRRGSELGRAFLSKGRIEIAPRTVKAADGTIKEVASDAGEIPLTTTHEIIHLAVKDLRVNNPEFGNVVDSFVRDSIADGSMMDYFRKVYGGRLGNFKGKEIELAEYFASNPDEALAEFTTGWLSGKLPKNVLKSAPDGIRDMLAQIWTYIRDKFAKIAGALPEDDPRFKLMTKIADHISGFSDEADDLVSQLKAMNAGVANLKNNLRFKTEAGARETIRTLIERHADKLGMELDPSMAADAVRNAAKVVSTKDGFRIKIDRKWFTEKLRSYDYLKKLAKDEYDLAVWQKDPAAQKRAADKLAELEADYAAGKFSKSADEVENAVEGDVSAPPRTEREFNQRADEIIDRYRQERLKSLRTVDEIQADIQSVKAANADARSEYNKRFTQDSLSQGYDRAKLKRGQSRDLDIERDLNANLSEIKSLEAELFQVEQARGKNFRWQDVDAAKQEIEDLRRQFDEYTASQKTTSKKTPKAKTSTSILPDPTKNYQEHLRSATRLIGGGFFKTPAKTVGLTPKQMANSMVEHGRSDGLRKLLRDTDYYTDGRFFVNAAKIKDKLLGTKPIDEAARSPSIQAILDQAKGLSPVEAVGFGDSSMGGISTVVLSADDGLSVFVDQRYYDTINKLHPGAEWFAKSPDSTVFAKVDGEIIGGAMPLSRDGIDMASIRERGSGVALETGDFTVRVDSPKSHRGKQTSNVVFKSPDGKKSALAHAQKDNDGWNLFTGIAGGTNAKAINFIAGPFNNQRELKAAIDEITKHVIDIKDDKIIFREAEPRLSLGESDDFADDDPFNLFGNSPRNFGFGDELDELAGIRPDDRLDDGLYDEFANPIDQEIGDEFGDELFDASNFEDVQELQPLGDAFDRKYKGWWINDPMGIIRLDIEPRDGRGVENAVRAFIDYDDGLSARIEFPDGEELVRAFDEEGAAKNWVEGQVRKFYADADDDYMMSLGKAEVASGDTRGQGRQFHGARRAIHGLTEGYYNEANIYGASDTFYTTDALDVASGYKRKRGEGVVYEVVEKQPVNFFDMEQPISDGLLANLGDIVDDAASALMDEGKVVSLRNVMDEVRATSQDYMLSKDGVQELFDAIGYRLQRQGYGGMTHIGGQLTGAKPHTVKIYFNPKDQIQLLPVEEPLLSIAAQPPAQAKKFAQKFTEFAQNWQASVPNGLASAVIDYIDRAGDLYFKLPMASQLAALFRPELYGATTEEGRYLAQNGLDQAIKNATDQYRTALAPVVEAVHSSKLFDAQHLMRTSKLSEADAVKQINKNANDFLDYMEGIKPMDQLDPGWEGLKPQMVIMKQELANARQFAIESGYYIPMLDDLFAEYFHRQVATGSKNMGRASINPKIGQVWEQFVDGMMKRDNLLRDLPGASSVINQMSIDPNISGLRKRANFVKKRLGKQEVAGEVYEFTSGVMLRVKGDILPSSELQLPTGEVMTIRDYVAQTYGDRIFQGFQATTDDGAKLSYDSEFDPLIQYMMDLDPVYVDEQIPLFGRNPVGSYARYIQDIYKLSHMGRAMQETIGGVAKLKKYATSPRSMDSIEEAIRNKSLHFNDNAYENIIKSMSPETQGLYRMMLESDVEDDLADVLVNGKTLKREIDGKLTRSLRFEEDAEGTITGFVKRKNADGEDELVETQGNLIEFHTKETREATPLGIKRHEDPVTIKTIIDDPEDYLRSTFTRAKTVQKFLQEYGIDHELANDINRFMKPFTVPEAVSDIENALRRYTNVMKMGLTALWPAFHVRNNLSAAYMNMTLGEKDPRFTGWRAFYQPYADTYSLLTGKGKIEDLDEIPGLLGSVIEESQKVRKASDAAQLGSQASKDLQQQLREALMREVFAMGIIGENVGLAAEHIGDEADNLVSQFPGLDKSVLSPAPQNRTSFDKWFPFAVKDGFTWDPASRSVKRVEKDLFAGAIVGRDVAKFSESMNRISQYIAARRNGYSPQAARDLTHKLHVNYSNLSAFESRVMRLVIPFYSFSRGVLPTIVEDLITRPGGPTATIIKAANRSRDPNAVVPDHIADTVAFPMGETSDGSKSYLTGFGLPFEDTLNILDGPLRLDPMKAGREFMSRSNPILKGAAELVTGRSFFQDGPEVGGRELTDLDPPIGRTISNISDLMTGERTKEAEPFLGLPLEFAVANSPLSRAVSTARTLTDPRKWENPANLGFNLLSGVRINDVSPQAQDAIYSERLGKVIKQMGGRTFMNEYFSDAREATMTPEEKELAKQVLDERKKLKKRFEIRRKEEQAAQPQPVET